MKHTRNSNIVYRFYMFTVNEEKSCYSQKSDRSKDSAREATLDIINGNWIVHEETLCSTKN